MNGTYYSIFDEEFERAAIDAFSERQYGEFDPTAWPRDPSEYAPTDHFHDKFKDPTRHLTGERIRTAITDGELYPGEKDNARFRITEDGVSHHFVVGPSKEFNIPSQAHLVVITGYPTLIDREAALSSSEWDEKFVYDVANQTRRWLKRENVQCQLHSCGIWYSPEEISIGGPEPRRRLFD